MLVFRGVQVDGETQEGYQTTAVEGGDHDTNLTDGYKSPPGGGATNDEGRPAVIVAQPTAKNGTGGGASPDSARPIIIAQPAPSSVNQ